jgi:hypothetical protein
VKLAGALLAALALTGCDKPKPPPEALDAAPPAAPVASAPPVTASAPDAAAAAAAPAASVEGVGSVPAWAPDKTTKRCALDAAVAPRLAALAKGDAAIGAGTADVASLASELGAGTCFAHRRALAQALDDGGLALRGAKKLDEANRHFRAALVVRPSLVVARYHLACGLAASGKGEAAVVQFAELARAAAEGDAHAASLLEKAKSDKDLESVRSEPSLQAALGAANPGLVGLPADPATAAKVIALLPEDLRKTRDELGVTKTGVLVYKPAVTGLWTWRPDPSTELLVATIIDDPAKAGRPRADLNQDYGAVAVLRRDAAGKLTLLTVRKTGESPPSVAAGKNGTLAYSFEQMCGALSGTLSYNGTSIEMHEKNCRDL